MNTKHQIFTPKKIIEYMLDALNYHENLYGKKVLESSCGNGNILLSLVETYILSGIKENYTLDEIKTGLEKDVYAVEIDPFYYEECLKKLHELSNKYGLKEVDWKLFNLDSLKYSWEFKFDYIIGNPPYIKYHDIRTSEREFLRNKFKSCSKGSFDYYYAFLENDFNNLSNKGKMVYLIPSNVFKNVYANTLRNLIKENLTTIYDFTSGRIFKNALTSSSIIVVDKTTRNDQIKYHDVNNNNSIKIHKSSLDEKWIFDRLIRNNDQTGKFGDYFEVSMSVATLLNEAYILREYTQLENYYIVNQKKVEKQLVKNAASPRGIHLRRKEKIIFPYYYEGYELKRYQPRKFEEEFPYATEYLMGFGEKLAKRRHSANIHWYEYGRTQALKHLNQPKLLMSTMITKKVKVYELDDQAIPYSGMYIVSRKNVDLQIAKKILESDDFLEYVASIGVNSSSKSFRITARDVSNFPIGKLISWEVV